MDKKIKQIWDYFTSSYNNDNYQKNRCIDFAGCEIIKSAYGDTNSSYNWNIDHIFPINSKNSFVVGSDSSINYQITSIITNEQKSNNLSGTIRINYYDCKKGKFIKTVYTSYEVHPNLFYKIPKNDREIVGIIFIKKQWDSNKNVYIKNKYFYDSCVYSLTNGRLFKQMIDLERSLKNNAICLLNKKIECRKGINDLFEI